MTKPKRKLRALVKVIGLLVLLAVIVPAGYMYLSGNGALQSFRQVFAGDEETITVNDQYTDSLLPGEAIRVGAVLVPAPKTDEQNQTADDSMTEKAPGGNALITEENPPQESEPEPEADATANEQNIQSENQPDSETENQSDGQTETTETKAEAGFFSRLKALVFGADSQTIVYDE